MNKEIFLKELNKLGIEINEIQQNQLKLYMELLQTENKKYNLTSIIKEEDIYLKHFYDSLTLIKIQELTNQKLCDIGTGAGFPGLVLKIVFPNLDVTLIEATNKKCEFLKLVINTLKLDKVKVINSRIEEYGKDNRQIYDIVTARALAPLKHLLEFATPLLKINGYFIPLKSNIESEVENINIYYDKLKIVPIDKIEFLLPIEGSKRTIIKYQKKDITNKIYPRNYNKIKEQKI